MKRAQKLFFKLELYVCPSKRRSTSCKGKTCVLQRKSLRKITSADSAPTQAKLPVAGLLTYCRLRLKDLVKKSLPTIRTTKDWTISVYTCRVPSQVARVQHSENSPVKLLRARVSFETSSHSPLQLAKHAPPKAFCCISIIVICFLSNFSSASSCSHPTCIASSATLLLLLAMNCAKSSFPFLPSFFERPAKGLLRPALTRQKYLEEVPYRFSCFFGFPLRSTVFRCFQTCLLCLRWGAFHQLKRMIFFSCVSPGPTIIGVNRRKIHLNTMVFIEIISHTQPSAWMREFYRHVVMRTP